MILTLSHQKGGVGKSTIAWNLAHELGKKIDVTIVDLDIQRSLSVTNGIRVSGGMEPMPVVTIDSADELADIVKSDTNERLIIIDSGGFDSAFNRIAIMAADMILTPISDKPFDLMGLKKYEEILKSLSQLQNETIKSYVVFNAINPAMRKFSDLIEFVVTSEHFEPTVSILRQRVDFAHSIGTGQSVGEYRPDSKAAKEIEALALEVAKHLNIV